MTQGLTTDEAAERLQKDGYNELPARGKRTAAHILLEVAREPMFALLIAAGTIYLLLGSTNDALMLLGFVFVSMGITIYQEHKTERVLETLRDLSSPRALVIRQGEQMRIPGREVVKGDLLVLEEGDRIAADGVLMEAHDLLIDESLLTGESVAVSKQVMNPASQPSGEERGTDSPYRIFSGSMIVQGGGLAQVTAVGGATEIGKIGRALQSLETERSPLQVEIALLVKRFAYLGVAVSLMVFLLYGWTRHDWLNGLLAGITLAMSVLPEEFTVILTVFMALGAWRISKKQVLTRHTPVIEALGSATVLCVDKTGTLTQNRMSVKTLAAQGARFEVDHVKPESLADPARLLLKYATLASETNPFDPMEKAIHAAAARFGQTATLHGHGGAIVHEYPLTSELMAMTHVWRFATIPEYVVATKGAPESVIRLCRLGEDDAKAILQETQQLATQGMRVLGVAMARHDGDDWPTSPMEFSFEWLGLVGLADPVRAEVPQAVAECHDAGIRVVMITGDYAATAQAIAKEAGLPHARVVTGPELDEMDDRQLETLVADVHVFARVRPEQKLRLVKAFKSRRDIVAMTGDGVNDAPALKAAHIGISMGQRGTDVAREASSLVLLEDNFASIVHAIRLGRRIYENLRKAMTYIVAVHLPIAGMTLLPLLFGTPLALAPVHIVFLEMIINPACAVVFENEATDSQVMKRPPRSPHERLFGMRVVFLAVLQGLGLLTAVAAVFFSGMRHGLGDSEVRALAFTCLVVGNLILIVVNRSAARSMFATLRIPNAAQWWIIAGTGVTLTAVLLIPALQRIFHFAPVHLNDFAVPALASAMTLVWFEALKQVFNHRGQ
ncbi:cation-translocating P-type ATPase [Noviherbaspirillum sp.]|uniref:cation-translocating P-type ATPase n=1 Tax=Noviherbaspirillum sp. TaxID=1926288 RepID=UPI002B487F0C|nr:cation-translocating P-type ATPase [Noviherbaspirillum sp.]